MTPEEFQKYYPRLLGWIDVTLRAHAEDTRSVASRGFPRLPLYFSADTLTLAKVVLVDQLPIPPLSSWGLTRFADFERGSFSGWSPAEQYYARKRRVIWRGAARGGVSVFGHVRYWRLVLEVL